MAFVFKFLHRQLFVTPPVPTASFKGRVVIITGSNTGLGLEASKWIVRLGAARVILAVRNLEKGKAAALSIQNTTSCSPDILAVWHLDMSSYASVQAFAEKAKTELPRLDVLIANAGINTMKFSITEDNESTITTNVVSTALIACLLHPKLAQTARQYNTQTNLTITASDVHEMARFKEHAAPPGQLFATLNDEKKANMFDRYNVSKLLDIFVPKEIAALSPLSQNNVTVNCVNPGFCRSELAREFEGFAARVAFKLLGRSTELGARTLVDGAIHGSESHGQYLEDCKVTPTRGLTKGKAGKELEVRVWTELREKLEAIRPGVMSLSL